MELSPQCCSSVEAEGSGWTVITRVGIRSDGGRFHGHCLWKQATLI